MNKVFLFFGAIFLAFAVTPCRAQFNDVRKKNVRLRVYAQDEYRHGRLYTKEYENPSLCQPEFCNNFDTGNLSKRQGKGDVLQKKKRNDDTVGDSIWLNRPLFSHPLEHGRLEVTSYYGYREDPFSGKRKFHNGTDFRTCTENVYAMMPGRIKKIGYDNRLGNYVRLEHGDWEVVYAHLYTVRGRKGDYVQPGHSVGISGSTGRSTGEHLHVSVKYKGKNIDPYPFVLYVVEQAKNSKNHSNALEKDDNIRGRDNV